MYKLLIINLHILKTKGITSVREMFYRYLQVIYANRAMKDSDQKKAA
jgi:hypothetical protein